MNQSDCTDANEAIQQSPMGGYCFLNVYPRRPLEVVITMDGEFDIDDLRRVVNYVETILEDSVK